MYTETFIAGIRRVTRFVKDVIALGTLAVLAGCGRDAAPAARVSQVTSAIEADVSTEPIAGEVAADVEELEGEDHTVTPPPLSPSPPLPVLLPPEPALDRPHATFAPERLAILTPGGPLLVDVRLAIDGRSHTEVFDALIQQVLEAGDADGRPKWNALAANREFLAQTMTDAPPPDSRQMKALIERFDANRDGAIQPSEAAAWLGRDAGTAARPLAVRSSRSYFPIPRATSQVWQVLDTNRDGRLSAEEMRRAPQRLLSLDADDRRVLTPLELASLREQLEAAAGRAVSVQRETGRYAAIHLEPDFDVQRLLYLLSDLYAAGQHLTPRSFPYLNRLFHELDANGDGWLELDELARLLTMEPHVELSIGFNQSESAAVPAATVELREHAPEVTVIAHASADRIVLSLGSSRLIVSAHDLTSGEQGTGSGEPEAGNSPRSPLRDPRSVGSQIRLMVHDQCDALFEALDENADGKLGEREIALSAERLLELDANGDGQPAGDELSYSMIVAFLRGEQPGAQSFYVPASAAPPTSAVTPPPWFQHADLNGDGEVSRREFLGTDEQFSQLDFNQDGYLSAEEAAAFR